jgi:FkbM family methyltransferase
MPSKQVRLGVRSYTVAGHSEDDQYFGGLGDGSEGGFFRFLVKNFRRDSVALDVGANIGITSLILSQVFDQGQVVAFEPGARNFVLLEQNLAANAIPNVTPVKTALSDSVGTGAFVENSAYGGMVGGYRREGEISYQVEESTIDAFVAEAGLEAIDLIKIDVEGHERAVLTGAAETIKRHNPAIYMEFNAWTLLAYGAQDPRVFIEELIATFDSVSVVDPVTGELDRVDPSNVFGFLHTHIIKSGCVSDLLLVSDAARPRKVEAMRPGLAEVLLETAELALAERDRAVLERDRALAERDLARDDRDQAVSMREELLASTSWTITAPLRRLSGVLRRQ